MRVPGIFHREKKKKNQGGQCKKDCSSLGYRSKKRM